MKYTILFLFVIIVMAGLPSCKKIDGSGGVVTDTRNITGFQSISLSLEATVNFIPDSIYLVQVQAQENLIGYIDIYLEGKTLVIKFRDKYTLGSHDPINIIVRAPDMINLDISGSGNIIADEPWIVNTPGLNISGSGEIRIDSMFATSLTCNISGSGSIKIIRGLISHSSMVISGSGTIDVRNLKTDDVTAKISGSGDIYCWAVVNLDATISGSGNIYYNGNPLVTTHISGSGTIRHL